MRALFVFLFVSLGLAANQTELTLQDAEHLAIQTSNRLKASQFDVDIVKEQSDAGFSAFFQNCHCKATTRI